MSLKTNDPEYTIVSNRELSSVLGYFSADMVSTIVDDNLEDRIRNHSPIIGNLVESYETNFKLASDTYPDINRDMLQNREETYTMILRKICDYHNIGFELSEHDNLYTAAMLSYKFLVSQFQYNIITFFYNFINSEFNMLYENLNLDELRKNKDSASVYSKKIYNGLDPKLAIIHANLDLVLTQICGFDIPLESYIRTVYAFGNVQEGEYLCRILKDCGDFFKTHITPVVMGPYKPEIITNIRLAMQPGYYNNYENFILGGENIE